MPTSNHSTRPLLIAAGVLLGAAPLPAEPGFSAGESYYIHYGSWDATLVAQARDNFGLVVIEALSNITRSDVETIQSGPDEISGTDDDVLVLGYLSIGEDDRSVIFNDPGARDTILPNGGTGPSVDPRANPLTETIASTVTMGGTPSLGVQTNNNYARFYLDGDGDNLPDRNAVFGGAFVNAGDPLWYDIIQTMAVSTDGRAGINELLTTSTGKGLGCDGLFMDTVETAAPNSFGGTQHEWTAPGFESLISRIRSDYSDSFLCLNRGLFFFNSNFEHYQFTPRPDIDMVMFESYYTDSSTANLTSPGFNDNKHTFAPKLNAEAQRLDGFSVIALGYDEPSGLPLAIRQQEITETQALQGWPLYQTNAALNAALNIDALQWYTNNPDSSPPSWDTTEAAFVGPSDSPPLARIGVQETVAGDSAVTIRWDVARDQSAPVRYNIYYTSDQSPGPVGTSGWNVISRVSGTPPANYTNGAGGNTFANEYRVTGLDNGTTYSFVVRAEDSSAAMLEDNNSVLLTATPTSPCSTYAEISINDDFSDWPPAALCLSDPENDNGSAPSDIREVWVANDDSNLYLRVVTWNSHDYPASGNNTYFDTDRTAGTGFNPFGLDILGSEMLLQGSSLFSQGDGGFNDGSIGSSMVAPTGNAAATEWEFAIPRSLLHPSGLSSGLAGLPVFGENGSEFELLLTSDDPNPAEFAPDQPLAIVYRLAEEPAAAVGNWLSFQ